ncbi:hypothetical protein [Endozoicomonas atrinae]|nr:hypothetical protein [Endozoicomonas atrinae]
MEHEFDGYNKGAWQERVEWMVHHIQQREKPLAAPSKRATRH